MREVVATSDVRGKSYERQALTESPVMVDRELPVCCVDMRKGERYSDRYSPVDAMHR